MNFRTAPFAGLLLLGAALPTRAQAPAGRPPFEPAAALIQINDVYRIDAVENGRAGGLGRVATLAARTRAQTPTLVVHAGDFLAPSLESRFFAGRQMTDALNFVHGRAPLLVVPGNHEFDERQPAAFAGSVRESRFGWVAGNLQSRTGDAAVDARFGRDTVVQVGPLRIGVVGLTMIDAPRSYAAVDTAYLRIAEAGMARLEAAGVDAIVALTHLNLKDDRRIAALKRRHPKLVWVAGGHEHFQIREDATDSTALITKGDSNARRVWRVWFGRPTRGAAPAVHAEAITLDTAVAVDAGYRTAVEARWLAEIRRSIPFFDQQIGTAATTLDGREDTVRDSESNWGGWLADQMRTAFPDVPADIAVLNGGAIRIDDQFAGPIRWEHLARTFGFPTRVALVWLRGRDVRQLLLEHAVGGGRGEGRFLQVSGLRVRFDRSRPSGQRVLGVEVGGGDRWAPLDDNRVYTVAVPDYLYGGGDGFHFKDRAIMTVPPGPDVKLIAFDALSAAYARGEAIAPKVEGRLVETK